MTERSLISRVSPISDEAADRLVSDAAYRELAADIARTGTADIARTGAADIARTSTAEMARTGTTDIARTGATDIARTSAADIARTSAAEMARTEATVAGRSASAARRPWRKATLAFGTVTAVAATAAAVVFGWPGAERPAEALSFSRDGDYVNVAVRDPHASPARLRAEFAAHGLSVNLDVRPASPSLVGALLGSDGAQPSATPNPSGADCGRTWCHRGLRIRLGHQAPVTVVLGRAPRPGERIALTGSATAPGEVLAGVRVRGRTVAEVRAVLRQRHGTVAAYTLDRFAGRHAGIVDLEAPVVPKGVVKGTWYVSDAFSGPAAGTVRLVVSPRRPAS
ncbi:hypothetical protein DZF91_25565 [Actinomadura logoneensis]|uniref:Uncharacterized protein n=1 Tax=Actinomadura logoneensis TaxID=2293572 RepID=A0A372JFR0_9ACTN|nr:hypothetical protein [Actinomadura logoneensis]RFU38841.1 hypothetical protein DZF91_25565 [Actinomadura logoneensis]